MGGRAVEGLRRTQVGWGVAEVGSLVGAQLLATLAVPAAAPALVVVVPAAVAVGVAAARTARGLGAPDGDVLLENGVRVSSAAVCGQEAVGRWAARAWLVAGAIDVAAAWSSPRLLPVALLTGFGVVVGWGLTRARATQRRLLEAHVALLAGQDDEVRRVLAGFPVTVTPEVRDAIEGTAAHLAARTGDGSEGLATLERRWSGGLDARAAQVATLRAARTGDVALARRWLGVRRASPNAWERYLTAQLSALVALAEAQPEAALAAVSAVDDPAVLPPFHRRQLALLRLAAHRAAGRAGDADAVRAALSPPLDAERWRRTAQPWLWARLTGESAAPPVPARPPPVAVPPGQPFAPPADDAAPAELRAPRVVGAVPVDRMPVLRARRGALDRLHGIALIALLLLSPLLVGLGTLLTAIDDDPAGRTLGLASQAIGLGAVAVGGLRAVPRWFLPRDARPAIALDDGRRLPVSWWWVLAAQGLAPVVAAGALTVLSATLGGSAPPVFGLLLPAFAFLAWRQARGWRLLRDAHDPDPARMLAWPRPAFGPAAARVGAWRALARLRAADAEGAAREAGEAAAHGPDAAFVLGWLAAARGEVELERLLAAADPPGDAARYREAVTLALAALAAGRAEAVAPRLPEWEALAGRIPNVHGDLLARLVGSVRRARGEAAGPEPAGTAWVAAVFPVAR